MRVICYFPNSIRVYHVGPEHVIDITKPEEPKWLCSRSVWPAFVAHWDTAVVA